MRWFPKKKIKKAKDIDRGRLEEGTTFLKLQRECSRLKEEVLLLEKESVYWKDKALNFRRFHQ